MMNVYIWEIFGAISIILLVFFWRKRNAVWGGLTIGIIIGFIVALFFVFKESGFNWFVIGKGAIIGTMIGFISELLGKFSDRIKNKK